MAFITSPWPLIVGGICVALGSTVALTNIAKTLRHYSKPEFQRPQIRIVFITVIYGLSSFFSLLLPSAAPYLDSFRDIYEAIVIYSFLVLVLALAGGENSLLGHFRLIGSTHHPWPLCKFRIHLGVAFLRHCKRAVLQFVFVKPLMAVINVVLIATDNFHAPGWQITLLVVYNVSYSIALYALLVMYLASKEILKPFHPVSKFVAVKAVVFATYWQSIVVSAISDMAGEQAAQWNSFILCIEMFFFSFLHAWAFKWDEFIESRPQGSVLRSAKEVFSLKDVATDAFHNFVPAYQDYVLAKPYEEAPAKTFRTTTFVLQGSEAGENEEGSPAERPYVDEPDLVSDAQGTVSNAGSRSQAPRHLMWSGNPYLSDLSSEEGQGPTHSDDETIDVTAVAPIQSPQLPSLNSKLQDESGESFKFRGLRPPRKGPSADSPHENAQENKNEVTE